MSTPDYQLGTKAKASIGTTVIKGLNQLTIPGVTRGTVKVEQFDQDFDFEVPTSASWEKGKIAGNYVPGDTSGQKALREKLLANEGLPNLRLWENQSDFWAPDLTNDASSVFYVAGLSSLEYEKSKVIAFSADLLVRGLIAPFTAHITGETLAFVAGTGSGDTITDSDSGFINAGFAVGQSLIIEGSTSNDAFTALVTSVEAGTLTLSTDHSVDTLIKAEPGLVGTTIHGGKL